MWNNNGEPSKYADIEQFVKYHPLDSLLLDFEKKFAETDSLGYLVYKYRFKEGKTFSEIRELLDLDNPRIVEKLDQIALAIRVHCRI